MGTPSLLFATRHSAGAQRRVPIFRDSSQALASRFQILRSTKSFLGKEDIDLSKKLLAELPGILKWALDGLDRVRQRGRFVAPQESQECARQLEELSSPIAAFVQDHCVLGAGHRVDLNRLYDVWKRWTQDEGFDSAGTKATFGRNLASAFPDVRVRRASDQSRFYDGIGLVGEQ
ncbi:MAG: primase-like DNA-binding domain-containing protein, partial [Planctomycetota bacterium]|nr:primase-like DNA-binding domain-containing protein [Planctomycetota bacterium]